MWYIIIITIVITTNYESSIRLVIIGYIFHWKKIGPTDKETNFSFLSPIFFLKKTPTV